MPAGRAAKAASVGAKRVNGPAPLSVSTSPAAVAALSSVVKLPAEVATPTMSPAAAAVGAAVGAVVGAVVAADEHAATTRATAATESEQCYAEQSHCGTECDRAVGVGAGVGELRGVSLGHGNDRWVLRTRGSEDASGAVERRIEDVVRRCRPFSDAPVVARWEGEVEITISGKPHRLQGGELILMPANQPHALKALKRFKMVLTMIRS